MQGFCLDPVGFAASPQTPRLFVLYTFSVFQTAGTVKGNEICVFKDLLLPIIKTLKSFLPLNGLGVIIHPFLI